MTLNHLFIKPVQKKYRLIKEGDPLYDHEIDSKCGARPFNEEHLIPVHYSISEDIAKRFNLGYYLTYKPFNKRVLRRLGALGIVKLPLIYPTARFSRVKLKVEVLK